MAGATRPVLVTPPPVPVNEGIVEALSAQNLNFIEVVGHGSFSEVHKAINTETGEVLAIKCFRQEMNDKSRYDSAAKEIAIMRILHHPNIISVKLFGMRQTYAYIGFDFGTMGTLQKYSLRRNLHETEVRKIMKQIVSAVDYMHEIGVCHGDLKLQNIVCFHMEDGVPHIKICDFGLFKMKISGTQFVYANGSLLYMAPEIILSKTVDITCDIWSIGIIMYGLMFKRHIYNIDCPATMEAVEACMRVETPPEQAGMHRFSPMCVEFLNGLLQYNPKKRLHGSLLRNHPFVNIPKQEFEPEEIYSRAFMDLDAAACMFHNKDYGNALVNANKGVLELQIVHNLINDKERRKYLTYSWMGYDYFINKILNALLQPVWDPVEGPISNQELRNQLASTPRMLAGFDMGIHAEMYLQEGNKKQASAFFHRALRTMLPLMKYEPSSTRKTALNMKLQKWIECLKKLDDRDTDSPSFSSMDSSGPSHF